MKNHLGGILIFAAMVMIIPLAALKSGEFGEQSPPAGQAGVSASVPMNTQETNDNPAQAPESDKISRPEPAPKDSSGTVTSDKEGTVTTDNVGTVTTDNVDTVTTGTVEDPKTFQLYDLGRKKVFSVAPEEFVRGALAAEMPPTFHPEALKAQAVAAHTYALCQMRMQKESPDPALKGADLTADPADWKSYTTEAIFRERYGDMADAYWKSICQAADGVADYVVTYEDTPIMAAYHSMSAGFTEDAANVWKGSVPYLVPVESRGDTLAADYETTAFFTKEAVEEALKAARPDIVLGDDPAGWFTLGERSEGGYLLDVKAGDASFTGKELRSLLDLRSAAFDVTYQGGKFAFQVRGYGHGVGFSQYGADYLARQGKNFEEILAHYYPGTVLAMAVPEGKKAK